MTTPKKQQLAYRCEHPEHDPPMPTWAQIVSTSAYKVTETTTASGGSQSTRIWAPVCDTSARSIPKNPVPDRWDGQTEHTFEALSVG